MVVLFHMYYLISHLPHNSVSKEGDTLNVAEIIADMYKLFKTMMDGKLRLNTKFWISLIQVTAFAF